MQPTEKQNRKVEKLNMLVEHGNVAILKYLYEMEEKVEGLEELIRTEAIPNFKDMLEQVKGKDGYTPQKGVDYNDGINGSDGDNYILTEEDKKVIASLIDVPVVEKVIEKREIIKNQPIVTEVTKEVTIENPFKLTGEGVVEVINNLSTDDDDYKIDASHIRNLPKTETRIETRPFVGGRVGIQVYGAGSKVGTKTNEINFESGFIVTESNGKISVVGTGSGGTWYEEILTRTDGTNYTLAHSPTSIVLIFLNGQRLTFGVDYDRTGTAVEMAEATLSSDVLTATYS